MTTATEIRRWAMPDARALLRYDADRADWLKARLAGVGGSEIGVLLGLSSWSTRHKLWQIKVGLETDDAANALMERGTDIEPVILRKFSAQTGLAIRRQGLVQSRRNPHMLFSVDALVEDGATVESKLVSQYARHKWVDEKTGEKRPPLNYEWQVRQGLATMGKAKGYLAALDADSWELEVYEIEARDSDFEVVNDTINEFWPYVETGTPPPIDYASATPEEMLARFRDIIEPEAIAEAEIPQQALADRDRLAEIRGAASYARSLEKEERDLKTRLTMQIGDREFLGVPDGQGGLKPILHWKQVNQTTFRQKDLQTDEPELAAKYTVKGKTRRLEIVKDGVA
jgi:putative phage-type endonuclease